MSSEWEKNLKCALMLIRNLRADALFHKLDPRAVRVALKYALLVDTHLAKQHGLTPEEDKQLDQIALDLFRETPAKKISLTRAILEQLNRKKEA